MEIDKGDIVLSLGGRDKGKALFVADTDGEYVVLVDGKSRKLEHPKRKKRKHCVFYNRDSSRLSEKLRAGERVSNLDIRRALATLRAGSEHQSDDGDETGEVRAIWPKTT